MKKTYETPVAEKVEFCYEDQIVASGATFENMAGMNNNTCEMVHTMTPLLSFCK